MRAFAEVQVPDSRHRVVELAVGLDQAFDLGSEADFVLVRLVARARHLAFAVGSQCRTVGAAFPLAAQFVAGMARQPLTAHLRVQVALAAGLAGGL